MATIATIATMENQKDATSMHVLQNTKDRFDSIKRQIEAKEDQDLRNSEVLERLLDAHERDIDLDPLAYDTIIDCLHFMQDAIEDEELPFDPTEMDEDAREQWLQDIIAAQWEINPKTGGGGQ